LDKPACRTDDANLLSYATEEKIMDLTQRLASSSVMADRPREFGDFKVTFSANIYGTLDRGMVMRSSSASLVST